MLFLADINECLSTPCVHGTCINEPNSWSCNCEDGYTGQSCETGQLQLSHFYFRWRYFLRHQNSLAM